MVVLCFATLSLTPIFTCNMSLPLATHHYSTTLDNRMKAVIASMPWNQQSLQDPPVPTASVARIDAMLRQSIACTP